jgi:hypothetical protein
MNEQPLQNLAFELLTTNQTLQKLSTILLEMQPPESASIREILIDELRSLQQRVDRLHQLTRPKQR